MGKLNLSFYTGEDHYCDGIIERELLEIVRKTDHYDSVVAKDSRWPVLYHLSPIRKNILCWYPFKKDSSLLEIGAGCGALTGMFCTKVDDVVAVELSKQRSEINAFRNRKHKNMEIIVGNLQHIKFKDKYDYITLIGVLEYALSFIKSSQPFLSMLQMAKKLLNPEGKLFIAIENRFGLKYWAGAREDHTGVLFDNIMGYPANQTIRTFGKKELENLLHASGFIDPYFYYPHPDYKMPIEIYSEDYLPGCETMLPEAPNFDLSREHLFEEPMAFRGLIENNQYEFFANSFLVVCGK